MVTFLEVLGNYELAPHSRKGGSIRPLGRVGYTDKWTAVEVNMEFQGVPETPVLKLASKSFIHLIGPTAYSPLAIALGFFT
jgi:hypothetical protein